MERVKLNKADLIDGEIYRYEWSSGDHSKVIVRYNEASGRGNKINLGFKDYDRNSLFSFQYNFYEASAEEKLWLETCEKVNQYIPLEDINNINEEYILI